MNRSTLSATHPLLYRSLLALLLLLAGLAYVAPAQAAITCRAPATGMQRAGPGTWGSVANFYEVPVGGVLTSAVAAVNTRIAKTGTNRDEVYMQVRGLNNNATYLGGAAQAYAIPGAPGLGMRIQIYTPPTETIGLAAGLVNTGHTSWETFPEPDFLYIQNITVEIVRAAETLPANTPWSIPANLGLPITFSLTFMSTPTAPAGATYCQPLNYSLLSHLAIGSPPLPPRSPQPITCTLDINNGNPEVNFGAILLSNMATVGQPPTGFTKQPIDVRYTCQNTPNPATPGYRISWHGTAATGRPSALRVTGEDNREKAGVGIVMESGNPPQVLALETGRVAAPNAGRAGGSSVRLHAYPTRTNNSAITPGSFKGTATIRINLY